jgi:hypothetical protein
MRCRVRAGSCIQREALDLAAGQLGRQRELVAVGADIDQGRAVVREGRAQRILKFACRVDARPEQPGGLRDPGEVGVVEVGAP